jgi:imidazolonepropionase-like amidohydrolase
LDELALMAEAGMTLMQIVVAATRNAAHVYCLERHLGKLANVRLVIHGDVIICQKMSPVTSSR